MFLKRIQKTLYCSSITPHAEPLGISRPFADYAAEVFSETHKGHTLNRLHYVTVGKMNVSPCSLILALIYLERLQDTDPMYARKITPTELFLVTMVSRGWDRVNGIGYYNEIENLAMVSYNRIIIFLKKLG